MPGVLCRQYGDSGDHQQAGPRRFWMRVALVNGLGRRRPTTHVRTVTVLGLMGYSPVSAVFVIRRLY